MQISRTLFIAIFLLIGYASGLKAYQNLSSDQFRDLLAGGDSVVLIDVRDDYEYDAGHLEEAHLYPWNSGLFAARYGELPAGYALALYCRTGNRSSHAAAILDTAANGMYKDNVYNLTSGITGWPYEVVTGGPDGPTLMAAPDTLFFGEVLSGSGGKTGNIILFNSSERVAAVVRMATRATAEFSFQDTPLTIDPGDSLKIPVTFQPLENNSYTDEALIFYGGFSRDTLTAVLQGSGASQISGDFNDTGKVDVFDLLEMLKAISGKDSVSEPERYDLNGDSKTDIFDLLKLLQLIRSSS